MAARTLARAGASVIVLEARDRIGGRLLTREDVGLPVPVELGGEFIHGRSELSAELLRAANTVAIDLADRSFEFENGAFRQSEDVFGTVKRVMTAAQQLRQDLSIDDFLRALPDGPEAERERETTRLLVEGFDAADPQRASTRAIAEEWSEDAASQTAAQHRPLGGYAHLLRTVRGELDPARVRVRLSTVVQAVRRHAGGVEVDAFDCDGAPLTVHARAAVVTLPIGVLRAEAVRFEPPLPARTQDPLAKLVMGPVRKVVLHFRTPFWEDAFEGRLSDAGFLRYDGGRFPTFWTMLPLRAPVLVAWAGGPKADALAEYDEAGVIRIALEELAHLFGPQLDPRAELEAAYAHDWQRDPYALGAYSYVLVGGTGARELLAEPIDGVLFFAGEAIVSSKEAGTVAGALLSGERAARGVLETLGRAR